MAASFFFYDLETSGLNAHKDRIMQFAGQRTDMELNPIGEPVNILITLTEDVLPEPGALLVTGITPQKTRDEGYTEAQALEIICKEVLAPETIIVGYNNIKFDDDFMRCTFFRNMYDPYEWQTRDGRSRWDLLDVVRITRALRPDGIEWPFDEDGVPSNRLEKLTVANGLEHLQAHDAMSDVTALIAVAKLLKAKQPKLYGYLFDHRDKRSVEQVVGPALKPFIYTYYAYPKEYMHTTVVANIAPARYGGCYFVYDLRYDPTKWIGMSAEELRTHCQNAYDQRPDDYERLPVVELKCNACPAIAPYDVLRADADAQQRLALDTEVLRRHLAILAADTGFGARVAAALEREYELDPDPECQLFNGFPPDSDKAKIGQVRAKAAQGAAALRGYNPGFSDKRLQVMLPRFKARNYPGSLTNDERAAWETYRADRLRAAMPRFAAELQKAAARPELSADERFMLEELQLYAQSIVPADLSSQDQTGE